MLWDEREAVILADLAAVEERGDSAPDASSVASSTGLALDAVCRGLTALHEAEYLSGGESAAEWPGLLHSIRLQERGRRATGLWPSEDSAADFIALIEQRLAETTDDDERTRLQRFLDAGRNLGNETLKQLTVAFAKHVLGLG